MSEEMNDKGEAFQARLKRALEIVTYRRAQLSEINCKIKAIEEVLKGSKTDHLICYYFVNEYEYEDENSYLCWDGDCILLDGDGCTIKILLSECNDDIKLMHSKYIDPFFDHVLDKLEEHLGN